MKPEQKAIQLTEDEKMILNLLKAKSPVDLNAFKEQTGLSNKKWDKAIKLQKSFIESMADQKVTTKMLIAEGDKVAAYAVYPGTMCGPMGGFPATGKTAELNFMTIFRISEGRIAEIFG